MSGLNRIQQGGDLDPLQGRVGLLCHHASTTSDGIHAVDLLYGHMSVDLRAMFSPEHGFSGTAAPGEHVDHGIHQPTGLPIYSLYGDTRIPKPEWLSGLDTMVIDLKDLGVRCYTYASSLFDMLHACAAQKIHVVVLDRKTPLEGIVDGPELEEGHRSFVGRIPLPLVYGLSQGALATRLQQLLPALQRLPVTIIPDDGSDDPWIPPSPAIVSPESALCYPITVWSEAIPEFWVDRGGPESFQVWAMPEFPAEEVCSLDLPGLTLQADTFQTPDGIWPGVRFQVTSKDRLKPVSAAHHILALLADRWGSARLFESPGARPDFFDQLAGGPAWRSHLEAHTRPGFL